MVALVAGAVVLTVLFVRQEGRAPEPVLPLRLLGDPVMRVSVAVNFTGGLLMWCGIFFVPLFAQEVRGVTPTRAGFVLMPLMFGAAAGTMVAGRRVERSGAYRIWPFSGSILMLVGIALLATLGADSSLLTISLFALVLGTGVGFVLQPSLLAAQNAAPSKDLGIATSTALLFRSLGNTVGIPIFGGVLNTGLAGRPRDATAFADAIPVVFLAAVPVAVISVVVAWRLQDRPLRDAVALAPAAPPVLDG
jgi:predicted MFS family arabinose efflux permease